MGSCSAVTSMRCAPLLLAAAILLMESAVPAAGQSSPQDYPQWRGQNRDGAASSFSGPAKWPDSLTRSWKVDVGEGYATPIVVGSVVYMFTRRNGSEVMMALNAGSGNELWGRAIQRLTH